MAYQYRTIIKKNNVNYDLQLAQKNSREYQVFAENSKTYEDLGLVATFLAKESKDANFHQVGLPQEVIDKINLISNS